MRPLVAALLAVAALTACAQPQPQGATPPRDSAFGQVNALTPQHISVPGTRVSLVPPDGFEVADGFAGFQLTDIGASILVVGIPGPIDEVRAGFTAANFSQQGIQVGSIEELTINGLPATLLEGIQRAYEMDFTKYVIAFGTDEESVIINGMAPVEGGVELSNDIRSSLLSVVYDPTLVADKLAQISYGVDVSGTKLQYADVIANAIGYTVDGKLPTESDDKTTFFVAQSLGEYPVADREGFSRRRLMKLTPGVRLDADSREAVQIDGLDGYAYTAEATNDKTGELERIYFVMLFEEDGYYVLSGVAKADFDENLALFRQLAQSFTRQ